MDADDDPAQPYTRWALGIDGALFFFVPLLGGAIGGVLALCAIARREPHGKLALLFIVASTALARVVGLW